MPYYTIRPRAGTKAQWEQSNMVLREREIGFEIPDAGVGKGEVKMKMGDGVTAWNELPYATDLSNIDSIKNIIDGTTKVGKAGSADSATNSDKLGNTNASEYLTKDKTNMLRYPTTSSDVLGISLDGSKNGMIEKINGNASDFTNLPFPSYAGVIVAEKVQKVLSNNHAYVELKMIYPFPGTVWRNVYNTKWEGWKLFEGEVIAWTGSAKQGSVISTGYLTANLFNEIVLLTSDAISMTRKMNNNNVYAGNVLKGGGDADWNLFGGQFDYSNNTLTINKAKKKSLELNTTSDITITAVIGRP